MSITFGYARFYITNHGIETFKYIKNTYGSNVRLRADDYGNHYLIGQLAAFNRLIQIMQEKITTGTCHPEYTKLIEEIQGEINVYKNKTMATQEFGQL